MNKPKDARAAAQKYIALNRKARHDYLIINTIEAGIVLLGTEIKSLRTGQASIQESFAVPKDGAFFLVNAYIAEYQKAGTHLQHDTKRPRKLLLHKKEMNKLLGAVKKEGMTIVPLGLYFNKRGIAKIELGIAKGKHQQDKRETIKQREWNREKARAMKRN
ncbi:MAG: SsrA-binding protein SmpB [Alphaproteobacteria bacterium]|nr:SsrA-binding protein SmpB [Alphaproteobacteria bacterium]MCL2505583.1 SsrA-binding protein SmpB [Alphaproteobacteria bacterium]